MPSPEFFHVQCRDFDPEQFQEVVEGSQLDHQMLRPGLCSAELARWHMGPITIDSGFYEFSTFVRGTFPSDRICIGIARGHRQQPWVNGYGIDENAIQVYAEGAELAYRSEPATRWMVISLSREHLQEISLLHLGRPLSLVESGMVNLPVPQIYPHRFLSLLDSLEKSVVFSNQSAPTLLPRLYALCVEMLASTDARMAGILEERSRHRLNTVLRADRALRAWAQSGQPYSSENLCRQLATTERTLQLYFNQVLGFGPKAWFRNIAMNRVYRELRRHPREAGAVSEVALKYGFDHLGRFSRDYKFLFGESPSTTLGQSLS